jgi:hypothetical protein
MSIAQSRTSPVMKSDILACRIAVDRLGRGRTVVNAGPQRLMEQRRRGAAARRSPAGPCSDGGCSACVRARARGIGLARAAEAGHGAVRQGGATTGARHRRAISLISSRSAVLLEGIGIGVRVGSMSAGGTRE